MFRDLFVISFRYIIFAAEIIHKPQLSIVMNEKYDIDYNALSDERLLQMVGEFIRHHRIERNIDQSALATDAGISRSTLSLMENGKPVMFPSIIRVLRVLDVLYIFDAFKVENVVSPMAMLKLQQKQRKRASKNVQ